MTVFEGIYKTTPFVFTHYIPGQEKQNMDLLVEKGVDVSRIRCRGYCTKNPVASNLTPKGRAQNRRIEITFISFLAEIK